MNLYYRGVCAEKIRSTNSHQTTLTHFVLVRVSPLDRFPVAAALLVFSLDYLSIGGADPDVSSRTLLPFSIDDYQAVEGLTILLSAQAAGHHLTGVLAGRDLDCPIH